MLISAVVAAVAACAVLAAMGFKGRLDTVGIDLGTTYSVVALRNGLHTDVLRDASGRALVPSAVYFAPDGSMAVGHDALLHQHRDPRHVIFNAKRCPRTRSTAGGRRRATSGRTMTQLSSQRRQGPVERGH